MGNTLKKVEAAVLQRYVSQIFAKAGMLESDAAYCAEALVNTDLWGISSHGTLRVPIYTRRLLKRVVNPAPNMKTTASSPALEIIDGDQGMGFLVGREAMDRAIGKAREYGIGAVGAFNSNHFGATALYVRRAAEQNMIGIAMSNVVQNMVVPGGSKPVVGNNPIAVAVPTFGAFPFVLDICLSAVAGGKLLLASKKNEKIPLDWATDKDGRPTDDPDKGFKGFLLPMAGHKGFGLALVVDILCGVLTGGAFMDQMKGMYKYPDDPSLTGHFMIAIDPLKVMEKEQFKERIAQFTQAVKSSPMWDENKEMLIPGEIEYRNEVKCAKEGIPLPINLYDELLELGKELGVEDEL
jgi:LDH2 family malate/lactate/ureidoglycolate dehydrogenase